MAHPFGIGGAEGWFQLRKLIEIFTMMGCVLKELDGHLEGPDGAHPIRFLYSPEADDFVSLLSYENSDWIPPSVVENWERRLGITVPKGGQR